jgi:hypothetical protein
MISSAMAMAPKWMRVIHLELWRKTTADEMGSEVEDGSDKSRENKFRNSAR